MWHKKCGVLGWICLILVIIGGINWGLIGIFGFNAVATLVGTWPAIERIIYILVGIAAVLMIFFACRCCSKSSCGSVSCCSKCNCSPCKCGRGTCARCNCSPCKCGSGSVGACPRCHSSPCRCSNISPDNNKF